MKTIEILLKKAWYTKIQLENFQAIGIINGCGGEGGFDFTGFAKDTIKHFPKFNTDKHKKFIEDIKYICFLHDLDYILGETYLDKIIADIKLAFRVFKLLYWTKNFKKWLSSLAIFLGTTFGGKKYFYDKEKYKLRLLIINNTIPWTI